MTEVGARAVGASVRRVEDPRILTGRGRYLDDVVLPGMLHAAFLRSYAPHGRLLSVDVAEALELPGVVAVYTGADMQRLTEPGKPGVIAGMDQMPGMALPASYGLAVDKVRHVGDPIALVVAESRYLAEDALELIEVDIEPLEAVVSYADALDPAKPPLFEEVGSNLAFQMELPLGDVDGAFARADRVLTATISVHRHHPNPMETRGIVASWDSAAQKLTLHASTQSPHMLRLLLPPQIGVPMEQIRVLAADVGGGFGLKNSVFREDVAVAAAAKDLGRPVKWVEDRLEHLATGGHAREEKADVELAVTDDGRIIGARLDLVLNVGAYLADPFPGSTMAMAAVMFFQGPMKLEALGAKATSVFSNKATYVSYRGPWATGDFLRERSLDIVARELGLDPVEVRRRNYVVRDESPLAMLTGTPYLGVTTRECLEEAVRLLDVPAFRERQEAARAEGRYLGLGLAAYLEGAPPPKTNGERQADIVGDETTYLAVDERGRVVITTRQQPHGQGHQTTLAQVAADELGVRFTDIDVLWGDTDITPVALIGTGGSRAATMANGSVLHGSRALKAKVLALAAELLEADAGDLELADSTVSVRGTPGIALPLAELARIVATEPERLPDGVDADLRITEVFDGGEGGWSGGVHACVVEVDVETGLVAFERYVVVEDCGLPVNPAIVEGQIRGGVAQAVGAVLLEHAAYDEDGQFVAASFLDYLMPTSTLVPDIEVHHVQTVLNDPDVNFRGVGEGGMIVAPAAITSAIEDALAPFGAQVREQHLPPSRILELVGTVPVR
ncbi:xanthine dehydrogenase family protein molybdopterin-binding subunit [Blastococcus sp. URHD0036]|uniref:xanthine dehydrogenase family protein molybdopterin-binding subunit n=1 Tax=Blastococcus sp. URHD0036 TaxID=1380356 RepID=UPI000495CAAA|nr:xanthine dehydrogenase family protein molybdopterin-binding subunit [Blastococcus sp. URHD0036]